MKKVLMSAVLLTASMAFALSLPGVCDAGDAKADRFDKVTEYEMMKNCVESSQSQSVSGYQEKLEFCSCLIGALSCASGKDKEKLNQLDEKKMDKAFEHAQKCYEKSNK